MSAATSRARSSGRPAQADPLYSDCGATVLANYQQTKISVTAEPQRADRLRHPAGRSRAADRPQRPAAPARPARTAARRSSPRSRSTPTARTASTARRSTTTSPPTSGCTSTTRRRRWSTSAVRRHDARRHDRPNGSAPTGRPTPGAWDPWVGYFQLRRFKFVDGANPHLDLASEQKILQVANNRGACCHVAGDIDFDKHNNLWLVTGDDTPSGGGNSGGFSPHNDMKTDETQTVQADRARSR